LSRWGGMSILCGMSTSEGESAEVHGPGRSVHPFFAAFTLVVFVCAAFATVGAIVVFFAYVLLGMESESLFLLKLGVKAAFFAFVTLVSVVLLRRFNGGVRPLAEEAEGRRPLALLVMLVVVFILLVVNVRDSPRAEPDELHHLIVSRNIAEHGIYGSGHPDTEFEPFDQYDSVGPPVLLPVAGSFMVGGVNLIAPRVVMALFFLMFLGGVYLVVRPVFGAGTAVASAAFAAAAPMSWYLGRTLYGEAPALGFLVLGLWAWRKHIYGGTFWWSFGGGCFIGLAILSKAFMLLAAFAFLGALVYDRMTARALRLAHLFWPAIGVVVVVGAWSVYESTQAHDVAASGAATIAEYQHNLMFGVGHLGKSLNWWLAIFGIGLIACTILGHGARQLLILRYDPPFIVLALFGVFVMFWWMFFTPAHIPRYIWYFVAMLGVFAGVYLVKGYEQYAGGVWGLGALVVVLVVGYHLVTEARVMLFMEPAVEDREVAEYVAEAPREVAIATTYWPLTRVTNFLADRPVPIAKEGERWDVLIVKAGTPYKVMPPEGMAPVERIGRYEIYEGVGE